ncbi:transposase [Symmachiella dynata]|uniref:integrase core domain-containing protein n=1 Tax=Symmachiella dynata TaxID=2527995 RepID=UPI0030ECCE71
MTKRGSCDCCRTKRSAEIIEAADKIDFKSERFHSRLRAEFLSLEVFENLAAARRLTSAWRAEYNERRPHSSLGYRTPAMYASGLTKAQTRQTGTLITQPELS